MKKLLVAVVLVGLGIAGWFGWTQYESAKEMDRARASAKVASVLTTRMLQAREGEGEITFGEYFKRGSAAVDDLEKESIQMQTSEWKYHGDARDAVLAFIDACKTTVRADAREMRLISDQQSAQKQADAAWKEFQSSDNSYEKEYASKRSSEHLSDAIATLEKLIEQQKQTDAVVQNLKAKDAQLKEKLGSDQGLAAAELEKLSTKPTETDEKQKPRG